MKKQDYTATIVVNASAKDVIKSINNVAGWWTENIEGNTQNVHDVFTIYFGDEAFVTFKVVEVIPEKKITWLVIDCYLQWFNNKTEWTNTEIIFEISTDNNEAKINFTHIGLQPQVECYENCVKGWDQYIKGSLFDLINQGKGTPQKKTLEAVAS